jgi:phospholipase C
MGFRVPTLVAGPYVKQGFVSSKVYDHTSALRELEVAFDLQPLNQRTVAANDLSDFIDTDRLARGEWKPPVEIPMVDPKTWEMDAVCESGKLFAPPSHPILAWADANPERIAGLDRRGDYEAYRRAIRNSLARRSPAKVR